MCEVKLSFVSPARLFFRRLSGEPSRDASGSLVGGGIFILLMFHLVSTNFILVLITISNFQSGSNKLKLVENFKLRSNNPQLSRDYSGGPR